MCSRTKRFGLGVVLVGILAAGSMAVLSGCPLGSQNPVPGETRVFHGIEFQWCPAGTFTMGSPANEEGREADETEHQVTLTKGFWLGTYEVTQAQWQSVMGSSPSDFSGASRPVEKVSWDDVQGFLTRLNRGIGLFRAEYRLPTEAEWEYAYRAGTTTRFYWGDDLNETAIDDYAWYGQFLGETHPVGDKLPNPWGLYDMSGNVYEWCQDWYGDYPAGPVTDPQGPPPDTNRVLRGGSWAAVPESCRAAYRDSDTSDYPSFLIGFRLLRTAD